MLKKKMKHSIKKILGRLGFNVRPYIQFKSVRCKHMKYKLQTNYDLSPKLPVRSTVGAGAYDLYTPIDIELKAGETKQIFTNVCVEMYSYTGSLVLGLINVRSGHGANHHLAITNTQGWIDQDYYNNETNGGNIIVSLTNRGFDTVCFKAGSRFAQMAFIETHITQNEKQSSDVMNARHGGFGSTKQ